MINIEECRVGNLFAYRNHYYRLRKDDFGVSAMLSKLTVIPVTKEFMKKTNCKVIEQINAGGRQVVYQFGHVRVRQQSAIAQRGFHWLQNYLYFVNNIEIQINLNDEKAGQTIIDGINS